MRKAEWLQAAFVLLITVGAWIRPLSPSRRRTISLLAGGAVASILLARFTVYCCPANISGVIRDWLPAVLLLVPYWQIGQFFTSPNKKLQERFAAFDRPLLEFMCAHRASNPLYLVLDLYFELTYLCVYPLIPAGLVILYTYELRDRADYYWAITLLATYLCLAVTPFFRALPPRLLTGYITYVPSNPVRALNQWILQGASIHAITFPSAHVAASLAASLVLLEFVPWAGLLYTWLALSIAVAAVAGGYHYIADVLLAVLVAASVFIGLRWLW